MVIRQYTKTALLLLPLSLMACGGGGGGGSSDTPTTGGGGSTTNTVTMVINTPYTVSSGDTVLRDTADAKVRITKDSDKDTSTVTLLTGEAHINRG